MYYKRLARSTIQASRANLKERIIKSKVLFFVEGARTEQIYLNELKNNIPVTKNLDIEVFDRWKDLSGESNQLKVVTKTKEYLDRCGSITKRQRTRIERTILLLESKQWTIDDILEKIADLNRFLGAEILSTKEILLNQLLSIKTCYDYDESIDKICFVLDRDCGSFTPEQYDQVLEICRECGYELGITSPNFEFFLLLHLTDLNDIDNETIFENADELTFKRLKEICRDKYNSSYRKDRYDASLFISNFNEFEKNILNYTQCNNDLKTQVGSSLGKVITEVLRD